jgi:tRNA threonylcarbamoyladenosine biosynthesis protein TsaB
MEPKFLIIETSGRGGAAALAEGDHLISVRRLDEARRHTRDLAPAVAELFGESGWKPRDVTAVIVSRGPGSYTGLRVGIMSAKAFAYAAGCAILGIETFAAIARLAPEEARTIEVLADAQQDRVYVQRFQRNQSEVVSTATLAIVDFPTWLANREPNTWVTGPGLVKFRERLPAGARVVDAQWWHPQPESLLQLGLARWRAGERDDVWSLEPLYLRPSSAEEKWAAMGK